MKLNITSLENKSEGDISLKKDIFELDVREDILHRVVRWQLLGRQTGQHQTKLKRDIAGTSKKPFRQKGTGNARQGDLKGPHMRGGYMSHGPRSRSHAVKLPKKIRQLGLKSALSHKAREGRLLILKDTKLKASKASELEQKLKKLNLHSALIIDGETVETNFKHAISNLKTFNVLPSGGANVYDILRHDQLVITVDGLKALEKRLA